LSASEIRGGVQARIPFPDFAPLIRLQAVAGLRKRRRHQDGRRKLAAIPAAPR